MKMFEYRVTKYDPRKRDIQGRYLAEDWTSYSQVGRVIAGRAPSASIEAVRAEGLFVESFESPYKAH